LEPFLCSQGVNRLDYILVSHPDEDHISGIRELLSADWPVGCLILSPQAATEESGLELIALAEEKGTEVLLFSQGYIIRDGDVNLKCLYPEETAGHQVANESSLVAELSFKTFSMLLTGDIDSKMEETLKGHWPKASLLKVAHHGSRYSTGAAFLDEVKPQVAVISCSKNNLYGHPHPDTLSRLEDAGSIVYLTMEKGAVQVATDGNRIRISSFIP
jgi:competence protein ComEC